MSLKDDMREIEKVGEDQPLDPKKPIYLRIDGKNFSSMVKKWKLTQPLDVLFASCMVEATLGLCKEAQGAVFAYTQSDEISIFLLPLTDKSEVWFNGRKEKLVSVAASTVGAIFNYHNNDDERERSGKGFPLDKQAIFDCRARNIEKDQILAYLIWRIRDSYKNAVTKIARSKFSHKKLEKVDTNEKEVMLAEVGLPVTDFPNHLLYGTFFYKIQETLFNDETNNDYIRSRWVQRTDWKGINEEILQKCIEEGYGENR